MSMTGQAGQFAAPYRVEIADVLVRDLADGELLGRARSCGIGRGTEMLAG